MKEQPTFKPEMAKIFFDFFAIERALANLFDSAYTEYKLTTKQWLVLAVATNIERPSIQNISKALTTSHQNVKAISKNLENSGYVKLITDPSDRRTTLVVGTEKLESLYKLRGKKDERNMALLFGEFHDNELTTFVKYIEKLQIQIDNIKGNLE